MPLVKTAVGVKTFAKHFTLDTLTGRTDAISSLYKVELTEGYKEFGKQRKAIGEIGCETIYKQIKGR